MPPNLCIVTKFCPLGCLSEQVKKIVHGFHDVVKFALDIAKVATKFSLSLKGMSHLHNDHQIIHRDLASRNCLLFKDENGQVAVKITDFGNQFIGVSITRNESI